MATRRRPRAKPGPKPPNAVPQAPALTKEEREQRNYRVFALFLAGNSEREIGRFVGVSGTRVHQILEQEMKNAARHHELLRDEALGVYVSRLETLIKACWPKVIQGDLKAIDTGRRLLEAQAHLYGLEEGRAGALPPMGQELLDGENPADLDELTRYRTQRRRRQPDVESGSL